MEKITKLLIKISEQKLFLLKDNKIIKQYSVSTSQYGIGNKLNSNKTPLGLHRISSKIGRNAPIGAIFIKRRNTDRVARIKRKVANQPQDLITTRILRLKGLERGINWGIGVDSFQRCIYIHGTPEEKLIGRPASHGCIRMKNRDVIELFNLVKRNTPVYIKK